LFQSCREHEQEDHNAGRPGQKSRPYLKNNYSKRAQEVECKEAGVRTRVHPVLQKRKKNGVKIMSGVSLGDSKKGEVQVLCEFD
jgi:hypothetical protein